MSLFAIVRAKGHQHRVSVGQQLTLDRVAGEVGAEVVFDQVLLLGDPAGVRIGQPTVAGSQVVARVLSHDRGAKILVVKKRRRKGFMKTIGHRQELTRLQVVRIEGQADGT